MPIKVPLEIRESQLSIIVRGLDRFYTDKTISYAQLEDALRRMSEEDLESILVYSTTPDFVAIANAVLQERGQAAPGTPSAPARAPLHPTPPVSPPPEVLF